MVTLGIDLGTSGVKIAPVGGGDRVIGHSSQPLTVSRPHTGLSEQPRSGRQEHLEALVNTYF
jgi:sugar (pentulose or hexulose) kinase